MLYGKTPYQHISNQVLKIEAIKTGKTIEFPPIQNTDLLDSIKVFCAIQFRFMLVVFFIENRIRPLRFGGISCYFL